MARVANSMVTFQDLDDMVSFEGFSYVANPITPPSDLNTCANKSKVLGYLDVNLTRNLANNQLVSYSIIVLPTVTDELTIVPKINSATSAAQQYTITVESNTAWTVSESLNWASLSATSGSGNGSITVTLLENTSASYRDGSITFSTGDVTESHTIKQAGREFDVQPRSVSVDSSAQTVTLTITSTGDWFVSQDPIFNHSPDSGNGNGSVEIEMFENFGGQKNTSITIKETDSNISINVPIQQGAA